MNILALTPPMKSNRTTMSPAALQFWCSGIRVLLVALLLVLGCGIARAGETANAGPADLSLDGDDWLLATDPANIGREEKWFESSRPEARPTKLPWIIQGAFPGYHGVAWYWKAFSAPELESPEARALLRFWSVSYKADVWLNGSHVGGNEGTEVPFVLDVTGTLRPGASNLLAVRVVHPARAGDGTDGILLGQVPGGVPFNHGGILDSVELLIRPGVFLKDVYVHSDPATGRMEIEATLHNSRTRAVTAAVVFSVDPTGVKTELNPNLEPGDTVVRGQLQIEKPRLWNLDDPFLYHLKTRVQAQDSAADEQTVRTGFRDFRVENGHFRLNGKRIFLRMAHTGQQDPFGMRVPFNPDWPITDLRLMKAMGFNAIRFFQAMGLRRQLDFADEFGFLVMEEPRGGWLMDYSPGLYEERRDRQMRAMVRRDRNHPCIVAWGLLNESPWDLSPDHPIFLHAKGALGLIRSNDMHRLVFLSSGRWDCDPGVGSVANPGSRAWQHLLGIDAEVASRITPLCGPGGVWPQPPALPIAGYSGPLGDIHIYPRVPHTAEIQDFLRTVGSGTKNVFVSEFGIASAVDLVRMQELYSLCGFAHLDGAKGFQDRLNRFMTDWDRWQMAATFDQPSHYFYQCQRANSRQRLDGINALRANPHIVGYSLTANIDTANAGEGVFDLFRREKPGMRQALLDGFAPLRWSLFAEPRNLYRGRAIKLEAVLANEDALPAGAHAVTIEVLGPGDSVVMTRQATFTMPASPEPPLASPVFQETLKADWPSGSYRLRASFVDGRKMPGSEIVFHVADPAEMPAVKQPVLIWGEDTELSARLWSLGIPCRPFTAEAGATDGVIVASRQIPPPGGKAALDALMEKVSNGAQVLFLDPEVFASGSDPTFHLPLAEKGTAANPFDTSCYYAKDEWAKAHPVFAGLPSGGILDFAYYRELLADRLWQGQDTPDETVAGAIATSFGYYSGTRFAIYHRGKGRWILNMYHLRENMGKHPAAERLLRNTLNYLASENRKKE